MTTRESVMRALLPRLYRGTAIYGSSRFGWMGISGRFIKSVISNYGIAVLHSRSEVESGVASMIAARPSVARVL